MAKNEQKEYTPPDDALRCRGCEEIYCECGDLDDEPTEDECHFGDECPTCTGGDNG